MLSWCSENFENLRKQERVISMVTSRIGSMVSAVSDGKLYWIGDGNISSMDLDGSDNQISLISLISLPSRDFSDITVVEDMLLVLHSFTGYVTVVLS